MISKALPWLLCATVLIGHAPSVGAAPDGELVDAIVAVVDNAPILVSDLELARLVHLAPSDEVLTARVALELQYQDLVVSGALYRLELDVAARRAELKAALGLPARELSPLQGTGLTEDDLEQLAIRLAARDAFVEQRLRPRVRVTLDDLRTAYRDEVVPSVENANVPVPELETVAGQLREVLVERRLTEQVEQWMAEIRARHEVVRYR